MKPESTIVILAAGFGLRYGLEKPKQYTELCGKEVLQIAIEEMKKSEIADHLLVVLETEKKAASVAKTYNVDAIVGGSSRALSFQRAMDFIDNSYPKCGKIVYHEAARPLIKVETIDMYLKLLDEYDYVESCKKITDSLGSYSIKAPKREDYYLIQAPEAYRFDVLKKYYDAESDIYFAANQFPDKCRGFQYFEIKNNIKLTTYDDKAIIEFLMTHSI